MTVEQAEREFFQAAVWYGSDEEARRILERFPQLRNKSIYTAALLGDAARVRQAIADDPASATQAGGPLGWDALTYLCFSRFLRTGRDRSAEFEETARLLLDAGADANTGFFNTEHLPEPLKETALYGAAGVAHHAGLTRLLLERGADPNDDETPYHAPETNELEALHELLKSGKFSADSLATVLLRKCDWHDRAGVEMALRYGADPNRMTQWGYTALHQAVRRDNGLSIVMALLDAGANAEIPLRAGETTGIGLAARRGRRDLLELFESHGANMRLPGVEAVLAACARDQSEEIARLTGDDAQVIRDLQSSAGQFLAEFAGNGNETGIAHLLDLGLNIHARFSDGDGYWGLAPHATALHVAAWRAQHAVVQLLIERGSDVHCQDDRGQTPLMLAVRACVDSHWTELRAPDSVATLMRAGANADGIRLPTGYDAIDRLLENGR